MPNPPLTRAARWLCALCLGPLIGGCAAKSAISGAVVDRNGDPVERVIVSLDPGDVELLTDPEGAFRINYMRDETGQRVKLDRRRTYTVELFRLGYHVSRHDVIYKRGELILDPITLTEDTVRVEAPGVEIDPGSLKERPEGAGATYEGE
ncbi:MAG: carboxypeptidase regulatory-like domain-containing protein [Deltaproteobacteria bacterium]|jgi:hypothetical protein|nr:carboxypeptidase regulatory-like domain-containing protein [Deltaproteobacteria bacterium]